MKTMKRFLLMATVLMSMLANAQVSQMGINYQCQVRNNAGVLVGDSTIKLRFSLLPGQFTTQPSWMEEHTVATDRYGIANAVIGKGTRTGGTVNTFNLVDFSTAEYWIKVEIYNGSSYVLLGNSEPFQSVPYAKVAGNASLFPAGFIMPFAGDTTKIPSGWLLCDGRERSRSQYAALYAVIADNWGRGNNSATFNVPDLRGMFLRGVSYNSGADPDTATRTAINQGGNTGNTVGSVQEDAFQGHKHWRNDSHINELIDVYPIGGTIGGANNGQQFNYYSNTGEPVSDGTNGTPSTASETRPKNAYVNYLIKY